MMKRLALCAGLVFAGSAMAQNPQMPQGIRLPMNFPMPGGGGAAGGQYADYGKTVEGAKSYDGLFKMYLNKDRLLMELPPQAFMKEYIFLPSISRGIAEFGLMGGWSVNAGDDWLFTFKRVDDRIFLVRKNVRFKAQPGTPAERAVYNSYTDSVVAALPVVSMSPTGGVLVDFSPIFMSDFIGLSQMLSMQMRGPSMFDRSRSTYRTIKAFPENVEIDVDAVYAGGGSNEKVADGRGVQLGLHYSISEIPFTTYRPRLADQRIGYFVTAVKDYTQETSDTAFVRYINRWHLEKADPSANPSPPKKPIRFYLESTIPFRWRPYVSQGILSWNKAFEKLGFANAMEVMDLPPDADPEDVRYNTFRWITVGQGFAMGPSRVNPRTGQILDADIIFDADMVRAWQMEHDTLMETKANSARMLDMLNGKTSLFTTDMNCEFGTGMQHQLGLMAIADLVLAPNNARGQLPDEMIGQAIREVTMHEVGHTLGLRHNFRASTWKTLEQINITKPGEPSVGSVMDYNASNIQAKGKQQGLYFPTVIGPYDEWAIEYGYSVLNPMEEKAKLAEIGSRSGRPEYAYSTDEDTIGLDPMVNRFDLGADPIAYSKQQIEVVQSLLPGLTDRVAKPGDSYLKVRRAFSRLLSDQIQACLRVVQYVGGQNMYRNHKGDKDGKLPFVMVSSAKQREALAFLKDNLFADSAYNFSPELLNTLAPSRWLHWGASREMASPDFSLYDTVSSAQGIALQMLLSPRILDRVHEGEKRFAANEQPFTLPELFRTLTQTVFTEIEGKNDKLAISGLRRGLQRTYVQQLIALRLQGRGANEDARSLASLHLRQLEEKIQGILKGAKIEDDYVRSHLIETQDEIKRALAANFNQAN